MRSRIAAGSITLALALALVPGSAPGAAPGSGAGEERPSGSPGAAGVGDPYFPKDGNGGYDVRHYDLDLAYAPRSNRLRGVATIKARATKHLSAFNLDLDGLQVRSVRVHGKKARWSRARGELTIKPQKTLRKGHRFTTLVRYVGRPRTLTDLFGASGFLHTDDGAVVAGQPHGAATWFPNNDHPSDRASYTFHVTVPKGLAALANGQLESRRVSGERATWTWRAKEPMASYLTTIAVGDFDVDSYRSNGIPTWDAIDSDLLEPLAIPTSGTQLAISQAANGAYKRLSRVIDVPDRGARLTFRLARDTEQDWDFAFVEAHPVGSGKWTTLPDERGHTSRSTGAVCELLPLHPFLRHYVSRSDGGCDPAGRTGRWHAASGSSDGWERWTVDLSRYAGRSVRVSLSYASDEVYSFGGLFVDDVVVSTGQGSTSFEGDGLPQNGWTVLGPPRGSGPNRNDWIVGGVADEPPPPGRRAKRSLGRQGEIVAFLSRRFGPYPFSALGGIVDDEPRMQFALETQTRPVYGDAFFRSQDQTEGDAVVVHELAHQWYGDSLTVRRWRHIWLNEGFATYAEWLWSEREGLGTARETFNFYYEAIPAGSPFWDLTIGDPGPDQLFDGAVYVRGAMTLHRLRQRVGHADFFDILRRWARSERGELVTTREFARLAERISGRNLDNLFETWLFTPRKPKMSPAATREQPPQGWQPSGSAAGIIKRLEQGSD
jgi:hypothetical protein